MDELSFDDIEEIMSDPPGGVNHGRKRVARGWVDLSGGTNQAIDLGLRLDGVDAPRRRSRKPGVTIRHGTISAYNNDGCRCDDCRAAIRDYRRRARRVQSGR